MKARPYIPAQMSMLLAAVGLVAAEAKAEPPAVVASEPLVARTEVVFGIIGSSAQPAQGSLVSLLGAELGGMSLSLVERPAAEPLSAWARQATLSRRVLAVILLDGRSEQGWRLVIIDAARGRAIVRALPGGIRDDAASVEAVASIVLSAAGALREGLEVASMPLAAVVGDPSEPRLPSPEKDSGPEATPAPATARREPWGVRGQLGASVASFSPKAPTMLGAALALGVSLDGRAEARVFGMAFLPALLRSPLGDFRVARSLVGVAVGPVFRAPTFSFAAEAGFVAERVSRYDATPAAGALGTDARALYRFGGVVAFRLRHTLLRPLSVELVTGGMYFGRSLQFTAKSSNISWSETAWPAVAFAQLGLEVATN
ncbi:MAG: hypothetical protein K0R38_571 [Polyangiaceae bacterium]|nr:hypothetical protein [Polyangiaceae bacterium]